MALARCGGTKRKHISFSAPIPYHCVDDDNDDLLRDASNLIAIPLLPTKRQKISASNNIQFQPLDPNGPAEIKGEPDRRIMIKSHSFSCIEELAEMGNATPKSLRGYLCNDKCEDENKSECDVSQFGEIHADGTRSQLWCEYMDKHSKRRYHSETCLIEEEARDRYANSCTETSTTTTTRRKRNRVPRAEFAIDEPTQPPESTHYEKPNTPEWVTLNEDDEEEEKEDYGNKHKILLIIDLDETMVHSEFVTDPTLDYGDEGYFDDEIGVIPTTHNEKLDNKARDIGKSLNTGGGGGECVRVPQEMFLFDGKYVKAGRMVSTLRPGLKNMLSILSREFTLAVCSAGTGQYVGLLVSAIDPTEMLFGSRFRARESMDCIKKKKIIPPEWGSGISETIILDDQPEMWDEGTDYSIIKMYPFFGDAACELQRFSLQETVAFANTLVRSSRNARANSGSAMTSYDVMDEYAKINRGFQAMVCPNKRTIMRSRFFFASNQKTTTEKTKAISVAIADADDDDDDEGDYVEIILDEDVIIQRLTAAVDFETTPVSS